MFRKASFLNMLQVLLAELHVSRGVKLAAIALCLTDGVID